MIVATILVPLAGAILAFATPWERPQRGILLLVAAAHLSLVIYAVVDHPAPALDGWLKADDLGLLVLLMSSVLFFVSALYATGYLQREARGVRRDWVEGVLFSNAPQRVFTGYLLLFLAAMTMVSMSHHLGLLWVSVEATTLTSAPLIYFHRHHRSLEATWKYLLLASVGIALALLGTFFVGVSATTSDGQAVPFIVENLVASAGSLDPKWLAAGFVLLLVGYGTKMGLAPLHTWLPDAHSEAPSLVSALMSGALLNCAFLGIMRAYQIVGATGDAAFASQLLIVLGLVSMLVAALFILLQSDFKRVLAYSSVEHMGIVALAVGIGGSAGFGAMFHVVNHSLAKGLLFLVAGNILAQFHTTSVRGARGMLKVLPVSAFLWIAGFFAITGTPPFGTFFSEFIVLQAMFETGRWAMAFAYLGLLALIFAGMATIVLRMIQGEPWAKSLEPAPREPWSSVIPPALLGVGVLVTGFFIPGPVRSLIDGAAGLIGVGNLE